MSNPYLIDGIDLPDSEGGSLNRTFVSNVSFNNNSLKIINAEGKVSEDGQVNAAFAANNPILMVGSIRLSYDGGTLTDRLQTAINNTPPFMSKDIYSKEDTGLVYSGSASVLSNGVLTSAPLIPDRVELLNNVMKWNLNYLGTSGASAQNAHWIWDARKITKETLGNGTTVFELGSYLGPKNFDTLKGGHEGEEQWARTYTKQKATQVEVLPHPNNNPNEGIRLEMDASNGSGGVRPISELGPPGSSYAGTGSNLDNDGTIAGSRLGSFMLLLNLHPDEKRAGSEINKTPPWDVNITTYGTAVGETKNEKIKIKMSKGTQVQVDVYGERTTFNLPSPPVSTTTQPGGEQDPNMVAISVVPVLNGINVSVGNYNGLDKKVSNRMTQFCIANPNLNINGLYNRSVDPDYDGSDETWGGFLAGESGSPPPGIEIVSTSEPEGTCQKGLVLVGDKIAVDLFNVTGRIAYIPLYFHTDTEVILMEPIGNDILNWADVDTEDESQVEYDYWPLWCKNGIGEAVLYQSDDSIIQYNTGDEIVQAPIGSYSRDASGLVSVSIIGPNPFLAGDEVQISGLGSSLNGTYTLTGSFSNIIQFQSSGGPISETTVSDAKASLVGERTGNVLAVNIKTKQGESKIYDSEEDSNNITTRWNAIAGRLNDSVYPRYPILIYGAIKVQKEEVGFDLIDNDNKPDFDLGDGWRNCIKNIQISHKLEGTTGSMTIDRYALTQIYAKNKISDFGIQQIGQVNFDIEMTTSGIDEDGDNTYAYCLDRDNIGSTRGILFKGFAYGFGIDQSVGNSELKVPLYGINKKLQEMKLYNAPFFDGRTIEESVGFFCGWGNVAYDLSYTNKSEKISGSSVLGQVRHEFKMGTSLWDALQTIADDTANYIIVQPDGKIYVYKVNQFGEPEHEDFEPKNWEYPTARIINLSRNPDFSQFFNKIIVTALQNNAAFTGGVSDEHNPLDEQNYSEDLPLFPIAVGVDLTDQTIPQIPWEKLVVKPLESFWTREQLTRYAKILAKQSLSIYYTGSTSIPGNLGVRLWDKFNDRYWIIGISHNLDLQSKKFTTDLELAVLRPTGNITEDFNGDIDIEAPDGPIEAYDP